MKRFPLFSSPQRLAASTATLLAGATLLTTAVGRAADVSAPVSGFGGFAPANISGHPTATGFSADKGVLTLTDGEKLEATSAWTSAPQPVAAWAAAFTYQAAKPAGEATPGDGFAFVLQNDTRGTQALGGAGNALGFGGGRAVNKSIGIAFNLFGQPGEATSIDGQIPFYSDTGAVDLASGHPIRITLDADGSTVRETFRDLVSGDSYTVDHALDMSAALGTGSAGTAYVGFTGSSGNSRAIQTIRDFVFTPHPAVPLAQRRKLPPPPPRLQRGLNGLKSYVDPLIGTAGAGNVYPGAVAPFGMVQFSPDTRPHTIGYMYGDRQIEGFSLTHMSGVGCDDYGDVFLTATTGPVQTSPADYRSAYSHRSGQASPGYYAATLLKPNVRTELTATTHAGLARFTFPAGKPANLLVPISHTLTYTYHSAVRVVGDREIAGEVTSKTFCGTKQSYTVYFVLRLDQPFASCGTFSDTTQTPGGRTIAQAEKQPPIGAWVTFPTSAKERKVTARIGISFVDEAGARRNLESEVGDRAFDTVRKQTEADWERNLHTLEVTGGTEAQRTIFYTSLYHCLLMPNVFSDVDGRYRGFDNQIHSVAKGHQVYANYSGWDIYRTEAPLLALIAPDRMQDMCNSLTQMYKQGGWIDRWPQANAYTNVMCGSPLTIMAATAWNYGLHDWDMAGLYPGMWKDATEAPPPGKPYVGEANVAWMDKIGYIPDDKERYGSVSQTEEDCIAYDALGSIAASLGRKSDADSMYRRALNYRNLFDAETKFLRPKTAEGTWYAPFDPTAGHGYVEGSGWHYRFLAPHDVAGLIHLFGGDAPFNDALDQFFGYDRPRWGGGGGRYYNPYNETDLQVPFLYDYSGQPWKTQALVRRLLDTVYKTTPDGIPGNDDCGTMSAWAIFGMIGLYPTDPARPAFELCSPVFSRVTMHLAKPYTGKTLVIDAAGAEKASENIYLRGVQWNGRPEDRTWVDQHTLVQGGTLHFTLGKEPNRTRGTGESSRPPSSSFVPAAASDKF